MKCPKCKSKTEVLETIQKDGTTRRRRKCVSPRCEHRFTTCESAVDAPVRSAPNAQELLARLIAPEFKGTGRYDPEVLAACIAVDQRKVEIRRAQRESVRKERAAWYETGFEEAPDSLDEVGLRRELEGY